MTYEHRQMRCKLDRSALIGGIRYRPGEQLREGHQPTDAFEEFTPPPVKELEKPKPVRAAKVTPKPGEKVHGLPPLPKEHEDEHGD
jgi:hypothetical protein